MYAPDAIVASVPITPIFPVREAFTAARAPGSITPITGTMVWPAISSSATALDVLHATTSILMPLASRNSVFSREYRTITSFDLVP